VFLLDVNVLIALAWDDHTQHDPAHEWFASQEELGFSTCHVTQSGFLRVSLVHNNGARKINEAIDMLKSLTSKPTHSFWNDGPVEADSPHWQTVTGSKQVPDLNLFLIARRNKGKLVTFDQGIATKLPADEHQWIEVVKA
jgi:uncharacterized protein